MLPSPFGLALEFPRGTHSAYDCPKCGGAFSSSPTRMGEGWMSVLPSDAFPWPFSTSSFVPVYLLVFLALSRWFLTLNFPVPVDSLSR